jgi:putative transcriptional regulator
MRDEMPPSRVFEFAEPDVRLIRERYGLTQEKFARLLGISVATLRNWEQGRRKPEGAARILLQVAVRHPEAVLDAVQNTLPRATEPNHPLQVRSVSLQPEAHKALGDEERRSLDL